MKDSFLSVFLTLRLTTLIIKKKHNTKHHFKIEISSNKILSKKLFRIFAVTEENFDQSVTPQNSNFEFWKLRQDWLRTVLRTAQVFCFVKERSLLLLHTATLSLKRIYSDTLAIIQVVTNCRYLVAQMFN